MNTQEKKMVLRVLKKARNIIETKGWCQDNEEFGGRFCSQGALKKAIKLITGANTVYWDHPIFYLAYSKLSEAMGEDVVVYNDTIAKDRRYVIRKFNKAINTVASVKPENTTTNTTSVS